MLQKSTKHQNPPLLRPVLHLVAMCLLLLAAVSCRVQLLAPHDARTIELIEQTARKVDLMYILLQETNAGDSAARSYKQWVETYAGIEADLGMLQLRSSNQPLNKQSVKIITSTAEIWQKYKTQHKQDNYISNAAIKLNRMYMSNFFHAMLVAEEVKESSDATKQNK